MKPKFFILAFASLVFALAAFISCTDYEGDGVFNPQTLESGTFGTIETEEPDSLECETAFAYGEGWATCFSEWNFHRWGWSNGPLSDGSYTFDIYAGAGQCDLWRGTLVGELSVDYDDGTGDVTVIYDLDTGWGLYETHLYVGCDPLPMKRGRYTVAPGLYGNTHEDLEGASSDTFTVNVDCPSGIYVVAHAVVCEGEDDCDETVGIVYGAERFTGDVYKIDLLMGTSELSFSSIAPSPGSATPNGLAFNSDDMRMYYCDYRTGGSRVLYFWDYTGGIETQAGTISFENAAADYSAGKYYYIASYPASDDLYEVSFNADGTILSEVLVDDISGNAHGWTFDGDIAVKDGVVYGWGRCGIHSEFEFFTYDLGTAAFAVYTPTYQSSLQLAFGSNGTILYGHRSGAPGNFYEIDTTNGTVNETPVYNDGLLYTDCASGQQCVDMAGTEN